MYEFNVHRKWSNREYSEIKNTVMCSTFTVVYFVQGVGWGKDGYYVFYLYFSQKADPASHPLPLSEKKNIFLVCSLF
jgi:hypothetical protein